MRFQEKPPDASQLEPEQLDVLKKWRQDQGGSAAAAISDDHMVQVVEAYGRPRPDRGLKSLPDPVRAFAADMMAALDAIGHDAASENLAVIDGVGVTSSASTETSAALEPVMSDVSVELELTTGWAPYRGTPPAGELAVMSRRPVEGGTELTWPPAPGSAEVTVYRVVAGDDYQPFAPESARLVAATSQRRVVDTAPLAGPVRYLQVWVNQGVTLAGAKDSQPRPHAWTTIVAPVSAVSLQPSPGRIVGGWSVGEHVRSVRVYRIPAELVSNIIADEQYAICVGQSNLEGFVDDTVPGGRSYVYRVVVEAVTNDGTIQLSEPLDQQIYVPAILASVDDLRIESSCAKPGCTVELTCSTVPGQEVRFYRSSMEPPAGIDHEVHELERISAMGFTEQTRLLEPRDLQSAPGRISVGVPWPPDWDRIYITPVTVLQRQAIVGTTISAVGARPVREPHLIERVDEQVLTFGWPEGAAHVSVYLTQLGADPVEACTGSPYSTINQQEYRQRGGVRLRLPAVGCRLVLSSTTFEARRSFDGVPIPVDYPGLLRIRYDVCAVRKAFSRSRVLRLRVWADLNAPGASAMDLNGSPPFVLVHNEGRLPLHHQDGDRLAVRLFEDNGSPPQLVFTPSTLLDAADGSGWKVELDGVGGGFIRLFPEVPSAKRAYIAVLDPAVASLRIAREQGRRR